MSDRSALELAESSHWGLLYQMIKTDAARAEECDDFGMMPLHWACTARDVEPRVVRKLVDAYPTAVMLKNKGGLMPLHIAIKAKASLELLQILVARCDDSVCEETPAGETPAELAELHGLAPDALAYLSRIEDELRKSGRMPPRPTRIRPLSSSASMRSLMSDSSVDSPHSRRHGGDMGALRARGLQRGSSSSGLLAHTLPPRWKMDKKCNVCHLKFTYFKSRHHCRNCGLSVCSTHSSKRLPLQHIGLDSPQRVCIMCYDELRENGKPPSAVANMYAQTSSRKPLGDLSHYHNSHHQRSSLTHSQAQTFVDSSVASQDINDSDLDEYDNENAGRPRAQTDMDGGDRILAMKSQVKELEAHMRELQAQKDTMKAAVEQSHRKVDHAVHEKHRHEAAIAAARGESIIDVSRVIADEELMRQVQNISLSTEDKLAKEDDLEMPDDAVLNVAATCHYLGMALFEKGDYVDAIQELRKSVSLNRRDPDAWYTLARALQAENEPYEAEVAVKRAIELDPKNYAAMSLLGKILHARGEHDQSIEVFQHALGLMTTASDSDDEEDVGSMTVGW